MIIIIKGFLKEKKMDKRIYNKNVYKVLCLYYGCILHKNYNELVITFLKSI